MATSRGLLRSEPTGRSGNGSGIIDDQEVARVAYELYEQRGREDGHDLEDWLKAKQIVKERRAGRSRTWKRTSSLSIT